VEDIGSIDKQFVWHPFTEMGAWVDGEQTVIVSGEGSYLKDTSGRDYLDGVGSIWCNLFGHRRPEVDTAIREQLGRIAHSTLLGLASVPSARLAERLVELAPSGLTRVFYSDNGSTANEVALKMAFQYWRNRGDVGRDTFIAFRNGYHGDTLGAVSVGGIENFHGLFKPLLARCVLAPSPYCYRCEFGLEPGHCEMRCLAELRRILESEADRVIACIIEPAVQGAGGMIVQPPDFYAEVRRATRENGVLLVADEVFTGFGHTGTMFASECGEFCPDFMTLGKGLTNGYLPLAATLVTEEIHDAFLARRGGTPMYHGHTFTGNQLGCAAALATLDIFKRDDIVPALGGRIRRLAELLEQFGDLECVGDIRQCGFIAGIELVQDKAARRAFDPELRMGARVCAEARKRGVFTRPLGDVLVVVPQLSIEEADLERLIDVLYESTRAAVARLVLQ